MNKNTAAAVSIAGIWIGVGMAGLGSFDAAAVAAGVALPVCLAIVMVWLELK